MSGYGAHSPIEENDAATGGYGAHTSTTATNAANIITPIDSTSGYGSHTTPIAASPPTDGYGAHSSSITSNAYAAYSASPPAPSTVDENSNTSSSNLKGYVSSWATESAASAMRAWEQAHVFSWAEQHLLHTGRVVLAASSSPTAPSSPTSSLSHSASYRWRSLRWKYIENYPRTEWNTLYQRLFESVASSSYDRARKAAQQKELMEEFTRFSRNVVELIMEEVHLPTDLSSHMEAAAASSHRHLHSKFLAPLSVGGVAGGEKFICNNVLFKFARDWAGLFGKPASGAAGAAGHGTAPASPSSEGPNESSDEFVQKSAANEIRHMNALIAHDANLLTQTPLFLTMSVLFRIRGSVVMCTALAPIQGSQSLVYGSADAGCTIRDGSLDPRSKAVASELAHSWNLAVHPVADSTGTVHQLPLATDIEIHSSKTDGRLYMLDMARFLPPTPPSARSMEHLYFMLRPEFMRSQLLPPTIAEVQQASRSMDSVSPLSADAFSGFGSINAVHYSGSILANMRRMKYHFMPVVAHNLNAWWKETAAQLTSADTLLFPSSSSSNASASIGLSSSISRILHEQGVNMRYLAIVRCYLPAEAKIDIHTASGLVLPSLHKVLLYEMLGRTIKQIYFAWVRRLMLAVGQQYENEADTAATPSAAVTSANRAQEISGFTEYDLERWMRRISIGNAEATRVEEEEVETASGDESSRPVSTCHHESSLLFALLLSLLFSPSTSSSTSSDNTPSATFFTQVLFVKLQNKFGKWALGGDWMAYLADLSSRNLPAPTDELVQMLQQIQSLLPANDLLAFQSDCAAFLHAASSEISSSLQIFVRILFESVGIDFFHVRHSLSRIGLDIANPLDLVFHVVRSFQQTHATSISNKAELTPLSVSLLYMLTFTPSMNRVESLPFVSLETAEAQFVSTLRSRSQRMGDSDPALLPTLWALLDLYEVQREEEKAALPTPATNAASASEPIKSCFEKGVDVLVQVERIFAAAPSATFVSYAKFGWFYLKFGKLLDAHTYFQKDYTLKQARAELLIDGATKLEPPQRDALIAQAQALESLGVIQREMGDMSASLTSFEQCLQVYQRIHGKPGIGLTESEPEAEAATTSESASQSTQDSEAAEQFRTSMTLATLYSNLSSCHGALGSPIMKRQYLEAAHGIMKRHSNEQTSLPHPNLIGVQINLSTCYSSIPNASRDDLLKAKELLEQCILWVRALYPSTKKQQADAAQLIKSADTLAPPATPSLVNAPSVIDETEDEHVSLAAAYSSLASVLGKLGEDPQRKISLLTRALKLTQRQYGEVHPEVGVILTNLGMSHGGIKGLTLLQQALQIKTKVYGSPIHNEIAITLSNMSVLYAAMGDWIQEYRSLQQALQIFMAVLQKQAAAARAAPSNPAGAAAAATTPTAPANATSLASNPPFLFAQQRFFRAKQSMAAREKSAAEQGLCSFTATGTNRTTQEWFSCKTCSPNPKSSLGACGSCAQVCHAGHELVKQEPTAFYCDCGEGVFPQKCSCLKKNESNTAAIAATTQSDSAATPISGASSTPVAGSSTAVPSTEPVKVTPFDSSKAVTTWNAVYEIVSNSLKKQKLMQYAKDLSRDILLLVYGFRSAFIVDVFTDWSFWTGLLSSLTEVNPVFQQLGLIALGHEGSEGVFIIHVAEFERMLRRQVAHVESGPGLLFIDVSTTSAKDPCVLTRGQQQQFGNGCLIVAKALLEQISQADRSKTVALTLPSLDSSSSNLLEALKLISLTTLCGLLLDYPVLYTFVESSNGNNLAMKALTRTVASVALKTGFESQIRWLPPLISTAAMSSASASSSSASSSSSSLICSFTIPTSLLADSLIQRRLTQWQDGHRTSFLPSDSIAFETCCWDQTSIRLQEESVTLPVVAL